MTMRPLLIAVGVVAALGLGVLLLGRDTTDSSRPHVASPTSRSAPEDPVAAAATFLNAITPGVLLNTVRRGRLLDRWADPPARAALDRTYAIEADRVRSAFGGAPLLSRSALVGYRVRRSAKDQSQVAIWAVGIAAGKAGAAASGWGTVTVTLRRRADGWRVRSVESSPGPNPSDPGPELARAGM